MVIPRPNGDVDVSMLQEAVRMIDGRFETEVAPIYSYKCCHLRLGMWLLSHLARNV